VGSSCVFLLLVIFPAFDRDGWEVDFIVVAMGYLSLCFTMGIHILSNSLTLT